MEKNFNIQFKILSALAICFVVCGHTGCSTLTLCGLFRYDSFHMPLFLFISGYFFSENSLEGKIISKNGYIKKQIKRLFLPWILWNIVYGIIVTILRNTEPFKFTLGMDISMESIYRSFTIGDAFSLNVASWFLLTLFIIKIVYWLIKKVCYESKMQPREEIFLVMYLFAAMFAILYAKNPTSFDFKILLIRVLYLSFWYEVGYYYRVKLERYDKYSNLKYFSCILILQSILLLITKGESISIVYSATFPFNPVITMIYAFNGIAFWLRISKLLIPIMGKSETMLYLANHTFSVMMHHGFFLKIYNGLFFILYKYTTHCANFDSVKYRGSIWWMYLPYGKQVFTNIDAVIGIVCPCVCVVLYERYVRNRI